MVNWNMMPYISGKPVFKVKTIRPSERFQPSTKLAWHHNPEGYNLEIKESL
jgi:hypothetical protein